MRAGNTPRNTPRTFSNDGGLTIKELMKIATREGHNMQDVRGMTKFMLQKKFQLDAECGMADMASVAKRLQKKVDIGQRVNLQTYEETGHREPLKYEWVQA